MKTQLKKTYETPISEVVRLKHGGVLCQSANVGANNTEDYGFCGMDEEDY